MKNFGRRFGILSLALLAVTALSGCAPTRDVRGNLLQDEQVAEVVKGQDTRSDVLRKLGSPTTKAPFDDNVWYYLGQETEKRGVLDPEVTDERVVVVFFDGEGIVQDVQDVDNARTEIPYIRRKTQTSGNEVTVLQQFFGNLGRFNTEETE